VQHLSIDETAKALDITVASVKTRLLRRPPHVAGICLRPGWVEAGTAD